MYENNDNKKYQNIDLNYVALLLCDFEYDSASELNMILEKMCLEYQANEPKNYVSQEHKEFYLAKDFIQNKLTWEDIKYTKENFNLPDAIIEAYSKKPVKDGEMTM